jgi:hypothetical protein
MAGFNVITEGIAWPGDRSDNVLLAKPPNRELNRASICRLQAGSSQCLIAMVEC